MDTQDVIVKLTTVLDPVSEESIMTCVQDNWKVWFVPNNFVVLPLAKLGVIHVKNVQISYLVKKGS